MSAIIGYSHWSIAYRRTRRVRWWTRSLSWSPSSTASSSTDSSGMLFLPDYIYFLFVSLFISPVLFLSSMISFKANFYSIFCAPISLPLISSPVSQSQAISWPHDYISQESSPRRIYIYRSVSHFSLFFSYLFLISLEKYHC